MRALLAMLLAVTPALAIEQIGLNDTGTSTISGSNVYGSIVGTNVADTAEVDRQCLVSSDIIVDELCVEYGTAPEAGKSRKATFRDNGVNDTSIEVTHSAGESAEQCDTGAVSVTAGQTAGVLFSCATFCSAASDTTVKWRVRWHTANDRDSIYCGAQADASMSNGATLYHWANGFGNQIETSEFNTQMLAGGTCTVKRLYAKVSVAAGAGESRVFTMSDDGSGTSSVTCTVSGAGSGAGITTCNDTSNTFATTAGESISVKDVASASATAATGLFGFTMTCDREGEYVIATSNRDAFNTATTEYGEAAGSNYTFTTTESAHHQPTWGKLRVRKLYAEMGAAAGGFGSYILTFRVAGADTDLAVTMTSGTTVYSDTSPGIWPAEADDLTMKVSPSGGPSGTPFAHHSLLVRDTEHRRRY